MMRSASQTFTKACTGKKKYGTITRLQVMDRVHISGISGEKHEG